MYNLWCFVALNCYKIRFLAIYAVLLRFFVAIHALLCGEKLSQKLCLWREKDKYHVCKRREQHRQGTDGPTNILDLPLHIFKKGKRNL